MKPASSFLSQPVRSLQTMLRTIAKAMPEDYSDLIPDGIYGPQTRQAVVRFQQQHELPATGITNQITWERISAVYQRIRPEVLSTHPLHVKLMACEDILPGEVYSCLYLVQAMLLAIANRYGCLPVPPMSGMLDSGTMEAISGFQRLSGLPVTGRPDKTTWKHLVLQFTLLSAVNDSDWQPEDLTEIT